MPQFPQGYFLKTIYTWDILSALLILQKSNQNLTSSVTGLAFILGEFNSNTFLFECQKEFCLRLQVESYLKWQQAPGSIYIYTHI